MAASGKATTCNDFHVTYSQWLLQKLCRVSPKCVLKSSVLPVMAVFSQSNGPILPWCEQLPCGTHDPGERLRPAVRVHGVRRAALQLRHLRVPVPHHLPVPLPRRLHRAPLRDHPGHLPQGHGPELHLPLRHLRLLPGALR